MLLISLIFFFVVSPFFGAGVYGRFMLDVSIILILILAVYSCADSKLHVVLAAILATPVLVRLVHPSWLVDEVTLSFNALFIAFVIYELLTRIFNTYRVTTDIIFAAISVYILIGIFWGFMYTLLEVFWPGSFILPASSMGEGVYGHFGQDLIYYSFVSLTTLGYGDITSVSKPAQYLSVSEAVTGQIYLTVLVARLVSMQLTTFNSEK
jgi:hypothetical protein